ncbi:MAG: hypothetical protein WC639_05320 [Patescibacteria group bacterium]|jgi:hypothetical protein
MTPIKVIKKNLKFFIIGAVLVSAILILSLVFNTSPATLLKTSEKTLKQAVAPKAALATYQFNPESGNLVKGAEIAITSATAPVAEGVNTGSWKGTLADDNFHWVVAGDGDGVEVHLDVGGAQLNGANKMIIQTEIDLDADIGLLVQICDWSSSTDVDAGVDDYCTGGGWRTLNTKNASQTAVGLNTNAGVAFQWHIYNGYWSTGTDGGTPINTPLANFINGSNQMKFRYYTTADTASQVAIDYLRVHAIIDPTYFPAEFVQIDGGTPAGHYSGLRMTGNTAVAQQTTTGDAFYFQVPGAAAAADFYLKFKNIETYDGMNTIVINTDASCSAATAGLQYRFKIRNFQGTADVGDDVWEDFSSVRDCSVTDYFDNFAKNNITIANYINSSNEIWIGMYALATSATYLRLDHMYIMLGTTNTDSGDCEISFGSNTAGRIAFNPSAPGSDRIEAMKIDGAYVYLAGFDSSGIDNEWRMEKRNLSDGELVTAFDTDGIITSDPSTGADQILAIASSSDAIFFGGYDTVTGAGQWRIEKRSITDGSLMTAFDDDGIIQYNPAADMDQITSMTADADYLYVTGFQDDDTGVWLIHKYDITTGALVTAFDDDGIISETLAAAGDERPQRIKVDDNYLYISGYDNEAGNIQWRLEKRNKTTGALCAGGGECAAGAFDTDGIMQTNPSVGIDRIYAMTVDSSYIYLGGLDYAAGTGQWRIEKRDIADGALVTAFSDDGIIQADFISNDLDWVTDLTVDGTYLYVAGFQDDDAGIWVVEKINKTTGLLEANFSNDGTVKSEDGGDDRPNAIAVNDSYVFIAGYGTAPGDNQWLLEKRNIGDGLRTNDSFSSNDCTGTRNLDTSAGGRNTWNIQTENESTDFSHTFYAWDNDGDGVVEGAGSANIGFSVTVPPSSAVTGILWAGRAMSGSAGTVRHAVKDYSGLTGTIGGRSLIGASLTTALAYTDPIATGGVVAAGGTPGYMINPEDYIDTVNNKMRLNLNTTVAGAATTNSVNVWDFAMVSFSWIEDANHPTKTYQFNPESGTLIKGAETTITSATAPVAEGVNTGSWKGTLADDNFHWVVAGDGDGVEVHLDVGGAQLNGANKMIIQTEIDLDADIGLLVQVCDWSSSTDVDAGVDDYCTGGGWRTLNTKNASQVAVGLNTNAGVAFQWHIYNGYWSTGTTGGTPINTPLANFINGSNQMKFRYYTTADTASYVSIDYLRVHAIIDPTYFPAEFAQDSGGTVAGHYSGLRMTGNTAVAQQTTTGDALYLQVQGDTGGDEIADFYLKFKNIKTYTGMNTILVNADSACSVATADLKYRFKLRNFHGTADTGDDTWEDISSTMDCSTTNYFNNFAKNNITISNYINSSNEIWVGVYALTTSATYLQLDHMYIMLGTTNTNASDCEISFGSNTAGRIASNPSAPGSDRIEAMKIDGAYVYLAGFDSSGVDNEWRMEKRNLSDGELVTAFDADGVVTSDPSTGADQILAIASSSDAIFFGGYDTVTGAGQWRIEKRSITDGSLMTAFDTDGIIQTNLNADVDAITSMTADADYLYVTGFQDDDTGVWRIHKYNITDGNLCAGGGECAAGAFDGDGIISETLAAAGDERPQRIKVDDNYLYISGYDNEAGNIQWRVEKRNKATGALCAGGGECAAGAFDGDGIMQINPAGYIDRIYAMAIDSSYIYLGGFDGVSATDYQWRIEKRDIATGALVTAFDTDGIIQFNPEARLGWITSLTIDSSYLYVAGFSNTATANTGTWLVHKYDITTGALITAFGSDGKTQSDDGGEDIPNAIEVNGSYVFIAGYGTAPGDNQWLIEKRDISNGLRTDDSFGDNDCTGTRDIDNIAGGRNAWNIQTKDESTNFADPYYARDNDGDVNVEEAGSAHIGFSVTVPANSAVTGILWAGQAMSGSAGTVQMAIRDYSGLTGTIGGRSLIGAAPTYGMTYTDPVASAGTLSNAVGAHGYMVNPEDYIDTVNNKMRLSLNTTASGPTTTNSVNVWSFAMVSFSWVETATAVVSITLDQSSFAYGTIDVNAASSTLSLWGGAGITATNGSAIADFDIYGANSTGSGSGWTLAANNTSNNYIHKFCNDTDNNCTSPPTNYSALTASPALLKSSVAADGTVVFQLEITTPAAPTDTSTQSAAVTIQASEP